MQRAPRFFHVKAFDELVAADIAVQDLEIRQLGSEIEEHAETNSRNGGFGISAYSSLGPFWMRRERVRLTRGRVSGAIM